MSRTLEGITGYDDQSQLPGCGPAEFVGVRDGAAGEHVEGSAGLHYRIADPCQRVIKKYRIFLVNGQVTGFIQYRLHCQLHQG